MCAPPGDPNSFNFMQVLGKYGKIVCWCPPGELVPPPRGNPGSATGNSQLTQIIDQYTTNQITYHHWSLKLDWSRCSHFVVGILPQHSTHISTGFFVQSTCLLEFYSRKSIICTQIMLRIKEKNKKISFKLIGIALS